MSSGDKLNLARTSREASPVGCAHDQKIASPRRTTRILNLHIKGFAGGVPLNTETAAVKPRVGIEKIAKRCLFFVEMAWAGSLSAPGPFTFRGCDLNSRIPPRHGGSPGATPGSRTNSLQAERQHAAGSPKSSSLRAARRQPAIFRGRGRKVMHLPCKQAQAGALPAVLHHFTAGNSTKAQRTAS